MSKILTSQNASGNLTAWDCITGEKIHVRYISDPISAGKKIMSWLSGRVDMPIIFAMREFPGLMTACANAMETEASRAALAAFVLVR